MPQRPSARLTPSPLPAGRLQQTSTGQTPGRVFSSLLRRRHLETADVTHTPPFPLGAGAKERECTRAQSLSGNPVAPGEDNGLLPGVSRDEHA